MWTRCATVITGFAISLTARCASAQRLPKAARRADTTTLAVYWDRYLVPNVRASTPCAQLISKPNDRAVPPLLMAEDESAAELGECCGI